MAGAQAAVPQELDFLGLEKTSSDRRPNFRGIQKAITKMNPEVIKSVIASSGGRSGGSVSHTLPLFVPCSSGGCSKEEETTAPMTIFYNGIVTAFDLPKFQAERIMKMVKGESCSKMNVVADQPNLFEEGLPISKRKSLERFFEKRKERLMSASPYEISKGPRATRS